MTTDIISTIDLTKSFNGSIAVDQVSFSVKEGEMFGFLGPNGAGKTTTIKMLTTLLRPSSGSASIDGFDIMKHRDQVRKSIGVVFQEPALDIELTGKENLDFHARMYALNRQQREQRITEVLHLVDLTDKQDVLVKNYSGGMKRRLEIARGLMHNPTVLFLDEPTLGLDSQTRQAIWAYIKKMNTEADTTIFLTTHYMEEAEYLCDRIAIIDKGKILVVDEVDKLKDKVAEDLITLTCNKCDVLQKKLQEQSWIRKINRQDNTFRLSVEKGEEKIPKLIDLARLHDVTISTINLRKPTLDDVFLHFTGREIRDMEAENPMKRMAKMHGRR